MCTIPNDHTDLGAACLIFQVELSAVFVLQPLPSTKEGHWPKMDNHILSPENLVCAVAGLQIV